MTKRIFHAILGVAIVVLVASIALIMGVLNEYFGTQMTRELRSETNYVATAMNLYGRDYLDQLTDTSKRITLVAKDGTVLYDSVADESQMENHADRAEVKAAQEYGQGESSRYSATLSQKTVYCAQRLSDGTVLRLSSTRYTMVALLYSVIQPILIILVAAAILAALLAARVAKRIVAPINALDLEHPEQAEAYDEIAPLLSRINRQNRTIEHQLSEARRKQQEFSMITENMEEGFLVIDKATDVLSNNSAALRLLGAPRNWEKSSALTLNRSEAFLQAVDQVLQGQHSEALLQLDQRICQVICNPVYNEADVAGAVLIMLDVTEKNQREHLRREFTANVSHELKTPLTSISGFAEIIQNGMVQPQDIPHFAGNIYNEAQRLIHLVEDIIRLSQLDEESVPEEKVPLSLLDTAKEVAGRLSGLAEKDRVALHISGDTGRVLGDGRILNEMVYNVVDNAIKYNHPGGHVDVTVEDREGQSILTIKDDGIGIPAADRERVFERFYRVDKSHSKEVGGTGLGLSIVKHGAAYHGATIVLDSEEGQGTTITITFPRAPEKS